MGLVRTCLFNWAYARHVGGTFVFRVEDTDANRDSEESLEQIVDSLKWLGLDWDEGYGKGGPYGPYRQSERADIYQQIIPQLLEGGYAYEAYSTPEEVEARHAAAGRNPKLGYDGFDRDLTAEQIAEFKAEGRRPVIRMRMPDEDVTFTDVIRGDVTFKPGSIPDYVIVRANGDPLYTLVNPVDDALMKITHILRGEDLLSSTPRQVVLYQALVELGIAEQIPAFGHLPYVMGEGNKKLSKRDPESSLLLHRENGMIPEGLLNYLALLGWSISPDEDIFSMEQMVKAFDIADVNPNPARFDQKKCLAINGDHIRLLDEDDFRNRTVPFLFAADLVSAAQWDQLTALEQEVLQAATPLVQTRVQVLSELPNMLGFLFTPDDQIEVEEAAAKTLKGNPGEVLARALEVLAPVTEEQFTTENLEELLRAAIVDEMGLKPRLAFGPLRVGITGRRISPPLFESMEILGKNASVARLERLRAQLEA